MLGSLCRGRNRIREHPGYPLCRKHTRCVGRVAGIADLGLKPVRRALEPPNGGRIDEMGHPNVSICLHKVRENAQGLVLDFRGNQRSAINFIFSSSLIARLSSSVCRLKSLRTNLGLKSHKVLTGCSTGSRRSQGRSPCLGCSGIDADFMDCGNDEKATARLCRIGG